MPKHVIKLRPGCYVAKGHTNNDPLFTDLEKNAKQFEDRKGAVLTLARIEKTNDSFQSAEIIEVKE